MGKPGKTACTEIVRQLTDLIEKNYPEGGKLPSSREMCQEIGTTLATYGKAIEVLRRNGLVRTSKGRGGTFATPGQFRPKKVGLFLTTGGDSPFLVHAQTIAALLDQLSSAGYSVQLIQGKSDGVCEKIVLHDIQLLIAVDPDVKLFPLLKRINRTTPVLGVSIPFNLSAQFPRCFPIVSQDKAAYYRLVFKCMAQRKHKRIMLVSPLMKHEYECIRKTAREYGLAVRHAHFISPASKLADFQAKFEILKPTFMLIEGSGTVHCILRDLLEKCSDSEYPEILLHYPPGAKMYRREKIVGLLKDDLKKMGETAARMVIDYFENQAPITNRAIDASSLSTLLDG